MRQKFHPNNKMTLNERINAFVSLGDKLRSLESIDFEAISSTARIHNPWFDLPNVTRSLQGISFMLEKEKLEKWVKHYDLEVDVPKIIGIIMAGNIPMVGFHDLICVLLSGNIAAIKMSSQDEILPNQLISWLTEIEPRFKRNIGVRQKLETVEAVLCTGSDNTARYFEYYFGKYPNVIRKNRTSVAILDGTETKLELEAFGQDVFAYYGLGCRNVSKVFIPEGFDPASILDHLEGYSEVSVHNKYMNNYEYNRAIYLVNKDVHLDNGFLILKPSTDLVSPISVLFHEEYTDSEDLNSKLEGAKEKIQCIVGHDRIPFGQAQSPEPWDYADGVDTMAFLVLLKEQ